MTHRQDEPNRNETFVAGAAGQSSAAIGDRRSAIGFAGKRVTVMGLGTRAGGVGVARYLAEQGAIVTVTDGRTAEELAESLRQLADLPIRYVLGRHEERDFTPEGADVVVRNPGVRRTSPFLRLARETGVAIEMEMSLFFRVCPAPIIGITGTKGKTTTTTLCATMLAAWDGRTVLAGNMGVSALAQLPRITAETPVVIELSSWQLEALDEHGLAPRIAVLTNIDQDHLDTYAGFDEYAATKRSIARHLRQEDWLVVNADDPEARRAGDHTRAGIIPFGRRDRGDVGAWVTGETLVWRADGQEAVIPLPSNPVLHGPHQAANVAAAAAAALLRGAPPAAVVAGVHAFSGLRDRMERVAEIGGVEYVNDTAATAPAAAVAALRALAGRRVHVIAGGADKGLDLTPLAEAARDHACTVYLLHGTATPRLGESLSRLLVPTRGPFHSMATAVQAAAAAAAPGEVVLLSPGCASFGLFRDEFERGERFREAVADLALAREDARTGGERAP
jgi:UDP-N-acetylmuramoylalanine--D-glutamate ligase